MSNRQVLQFVFASQVEAQEWIDKRIVRIAYKFVRGGLDGSDGVIADRTDPSYKADAADVPLSTRSKIVKDGKNFRVALKFGGQGG